MTYYVLARIYKLDFPKVSIRLYPRLRLWSIFIDCNALTFSFWSFFFFTFFQCDSLAFILFYFLSFILCYSPVFSAEAVILSFSFFSDSIIFSDLYSVKVCDRYLKESAQTIYRQFKRPYRALNFEENFTKIELSIQEICPLNISKWLTFDQHRSRHFEGLVMWPKYKILVNNNEVFFTTTFKCMYLIQGRSIFSYTGKYFS